MDKEKKKYITNKYVTNKWDGFFRDMFSGVDYGVFRLLFRLLIFLLILSNVVNLIYPLSRLPEENKESYMACLDSCEAPKGEHTLKMAGKEYVSINKDDLIGIPSCIISCNDMYLRLRNK